MVDAAIETLREVDVAVLVVDAGDQAGRRRRVRAGTCVKRSKVPRSWP